MEIIANNTVEEDILEALEGVQSDFYYSKISAVHGRGRTDPRKGDAVWPEENFIFVIYCEENEAFRFRDAVGNVKAKFTREGIKVFAIPFNETIGS